MASPWEQSSRDKCHPPDLSRVERGIEKDGGREAIICPVIQENLPAVERHLHGTGAASPPPPSLYLTSMGGAADRREWAVSWLPALSGTHLLYPLLGPHIYLSIQVYTRAHMHAHTERPVQFPCRTGGERQRNGRWGRGEGPVGVGKGLRCQEHSN